MRTFADVICPIPEELAPSQWRSAGRWRDRGRRRHRWWWGRVERGSGRKEHALRTLGTFDDVSAGDHGEEGRAGTREKLAPSRPLDMQLKIATEVLADPQKRGTATDEDRTAMVVIVVAKKKKVDDRATRSPHSAMPSRATSPQLRLPHQYLRRGARCRQVRLTM